MALIRGVYDTDGDVFGNLNPFNGYLKGFVFSDKREVSSLPSRSALL